MLTNLKSPVLHSQYRRDLKQKIAASQRQIRQNIAINNAKTIHRTQAINRKCPYESMEEEQTARQAILAEQIKTWRRLLPQLLMKFSRIPDPRRSKSIKHQLVVLMIFGLFAFVFRLSSRREMNRELTGAAVTTNLRKLFPELDSIPHADTLALLLEKINSARIESAHIELIKKLIRGKKLNKLLINQCLPISIDGAQKLFREGLLHDSHWLQRSLGSEDNKKDQQYVYAIEANITLKNGLIYRS